MKNKVFTVSKAEIDSGLEKSIDTYIDINDVSPSGAYEARRYYPRKVNFLNTSGTTISANIFSSDAEIMAYSGSPTNYDFFTIPNGTSLILTASSILPTAYQIKVIGSGTASTGMNIECIGYQPYR